MAGSCFAFLNLDLATFTTKLLGPSYKQDAELDDSIECYRQRLKKIRQRNHEEATHKVMEKAPETWPLQILEAKLQSTIPTDAESVSTEFTDPQSDPESDDENKSSDGDQIDSPKARKIFNGCVAALPGADSDSVRPRVGPRGGLMLQRLHVVGPRRSSLFHAAPTPTHWAAYA
jgi:hypothetical protein